MEKLYETAQQLAKTNLRLAATNLELTGEHAKAHAKAQKTLATTQIIRKSIMFLIGLAIIGYFFYNTFAGN